MLISVSHPLLGQIRVSSSVLDGSCPGRLLDITFSPGEIPTIVPANGFKLASEDVYYLCEGQASLGCSDSSFVGRTFVFYSPVPLMGVE
jgi:hypothetical protein